MTRFIVRYRCRLLVGILIGLNLFQIVSWSFGKVLNQPEKVLNQPSHQMDTKNIPFDTKPADELYSEVKVLCWVMISPKSHRTRGILIKNTWGRRCNKLLFMSTIRDPEIDSIALPMKEKITHLWTKTTKAFQFIHDNHFNDFDWFLKADDDTFMIMENVRHMLYQYRPQTALYFGHRMTGNGSLDGFMQGGAYILSRKAVEKFVKLYPTFGKTKGWAEDLYMGMCLTNKSIFVDTRDDVKQARFLMFGVEKYFPSKFNPKSWFYEKSFYDAPHGTLDCCSDMPVGVHFIKNPRELSLLEYLIYHVHPFGVDKTSSDVRPRKLSLKEILEASDFGSNSRLYKKHKTIHEMESSEKF